ncbi:MAG: protoheme IX farnesyltransferase [Rhodospirillales bacterium]|nr:protoheme IX farnesyltransferase [Rhodospirillales bacterium]
MSTVRSDGAGLAATAAAAATPEPRFQLRDYAILLKPRVMSLVVFTGMVGLLLAPTPMDAATALVAVACIALGAGASGAINMWYDRDIDSVMQRTMNRPIPAGRLQPASALAFGVVLACLSVASMATLVNVAAAGLLALTIVYYVFIYTMWLKRRTPQNIVIGGASGALPPVIGWAAATGDVSWSALALFAIIFLWTPPHSWALALFRRGDYDRAGVPMMPVVAGERSTRTQILAYTVLLVPATFLPVILGMSGWLYAVAAAGLDVALLHHAVRVYRSDDPRTARGLFFFSILYLFLIFAALLLDRAMSVLAVL